MAKVVRRRGRPTEPAAQYRAAAKAFRARMLSGQWPPGMVLPPMRSLAAEMGLGENTVRQALAALRSEDRIATNPRRRLCVKEPEGSVSVHGNLVVQLLTSPVSHSQSSPYFNAMQRGIDLGVGELDAPLLILHGKHLRGAFPEYLLDLPIRGIVAYGLFQPAMLKRLERLGVPVVLADVPCAGRAFHSVSVDNEGPAADAVRRLVELGHRHIAFMRPVHVSVRDVDADSKERQRGFERAIRQAGLLLKRCPVFNVFSRDTPEGPAYQAVLQSRPMVTAVIAADATLAQNMQKAAQRANLAVPRDLSIVCWLEAADQAVWSGLRVDFQALAKRAVLLLKEPARPGQHIRVPARWDQGRTIGPVPA